jgi:predicted TIM-barrel fold metal-dependent hydrolase
MVPLQGCDWWAALKIVSEVANIAVVVSGLLTERGIVEQSIALLGERRVLFGSGMLRIHPACGLGAVQEADLTERQRSMVTDANTRQWLGL